MQISTLACSVISFPMVLCALWATPAMAEPKLFGASETVSSSISNFPKWTGVLSRYERDRIKAEADCSKQTKSCSLKRWLEALDGFESASKREQLNRVNDFANRTPYVLDIVNWGMEDYWATPIQFFIKNGDCEDYAIAKYKSLRQLGFPASSLRIVILNDQNLGILHAVLAVYLDGTVYILDNQIKQVVEHTRIRHYKPVYSINEQQWWRHRT